VLDLPPFSDAALLRDQVVVVAERRERSLAETPAAISVLDAEEISSVDADHPAELLNRAPGVYIHRGSGAEHLTAIRSPVLTGGAGAGSFLFLENGVPLRSAGFANVNGLFEAHLEIADGVDIVRGPSGALYGANAIHGVIDVRTPEPRVEAGGSLMVSGDTEDRYGGSLVLTGGHGSQSVLGGLTLVSEDGFRAASGVDTQRLTLSHAYRGASVDATTVFSAYNLNQETAGFVEGENAYLDPALRRSNAFPQAFRDSAGARLSSRIDWTIDKTRSLSVTPFARVTDMEFLQHFLPSQAIEDTGHWSVGSQAAFYYDEDGRWSGVVGFDWEGTRGYLSEVQSIPTVFSFTQGVHYDYSVIALTASPFVKTAYRLTERLEARLAARLDWTRYDYDNKLDGEPQDIGRFRRPADRADEFATLSPKASLLWRAADEQSVYVAYARGARPPQTSDLYRLQTTQGVGEIEPETIDSVEFGWRGSVRGVDWDFAAFAMEKRNYFFRDADGLNEPDGKTRHVGLEWSLRWSPAPWAVLATRGTLAEHTYRFDRDVGADTEDIVAGAEVDTAPTTLASTTLALRPAPPARLELQWVHVGAYFTDAANANDYPGHDVLNIRGGWDVGSSEVFFALRNALDSFYATRADFAFGNERYFPAEERTLALGVRARF